MSPVTDPPRNELGGETSPYLRQHAANPVAWLPWGEAAFERAEREDKPILLSVGYSACHWCHVMAHESFEDPATAEQMNRDFVCVKVDREERPDVDAVYMAAVQAMTGHGGWPMTVVLTPDGRPFFGGTYFPKTARYGQPAFRTVLTSLADAWANRREEVEAAAEGATRAIEAMQRAVERRRSTDADGPADDRAAAAPALERARWALRAAFDAQHAGFGGAPKFPPHGALRFLLRQRDEELRAMAVRTLEAMAAGGIYDQLGGGFARYSVDAIWRVPHFEKMLYDNALLLGAYAEAAARTDDARARRVALETAGFLLRELRAPGGAFFSALDADSEGEEGRFYTWTAEAFDAAAGPDAALARTRFGVRASGDLEGKNVLHLAATVDEAAARHGVDPDDARRRLGRARERLLAARATRVRPGLDDKVLASWNGLALGGLAEAGRLLARPDLTEAARDAAAFLRRELWRPGDGQRPGRLWHVWHADVGARVEGLLEDYAYLGLGLLALYRSTFEPRWLRWALELGTAIEARFADPEGGYFSTADDPERAGAADALVVRPKDRYDAATPGASNAAAQLLLRLARITGRSSREASAVRAVAPMLEAVAERPTGFASALQTLEEALAPPLEVLLVGPADDDAMRALVGVLSRPLPFVAVARIDDADDPLAQEIAWAQGRGRVDGRPTAYVCSAGTCRLPVTDPEALERELAAVGAAEPAPGRRRRDPEPPTP